MKLAVIHNTFRSWVQDLQEQGLKASFAHSLEAEVEDQLLVSAVLLTARLDPKRRAHGSARREAPSRPLARLCYLISVGSAKLHPQGEQALLQLMVQAQNTPGMSLLAEAPSSSWWLASGVVPRPAFLLEACVSEAVEQEAVPQVRGHRLEMTGVHRVHGCVLAADATPIAGAEIQLIATGQVVCSDNYGTFHLQVCDPGPGQTHGQVRVRARGVEQHFEIPGPATAQHPWLISLEQLGC